MNAEIIAVGSEMLTHKRVDTNSLFLTEQLNNLGIEVTAKHVIGDDLERLAGTIRRALGAAPLVILSGGLGPTEDDLTRDAVALALDRRLVFNAAINDGIEQRFRQMNRAMPEINRRQAMLIEGAHVLSNDRGTAPGQWIEANGHILILLPGVPAELRALMEAEVGPRLARLGNKTRLYTRDLRIVGLFESEVDQRVAPLYAQYPDTETTILATAKGIELHPRIWSDDPKHAEARLDELVSRMALALGENLVSTRGELIEEVVARMLTENRATIAVAESCTGGLVAERLTSISGSSAYFLGGVVCYSNQLKTQLVGVPAELIEAKGAVSPEVALALADGIRKQTGATLGVGITGIAGPTGGTPEKPVGLVHIGIADQRGPQEKAWRFPGDRERIRFFAMQNALDAVRRYFLFPPVSKKVSA